MPEIEYDMSRIPADDRIKSIRGFYRIVARCGDAVDFAIRKTEQEARDKARERLLYRMDGFW